MLVPLNVSVPQNKAGWGGQFIKVSEFKDALMGIQPFLGITDFLISHGQFSCTFWGIGDKFSALLYQKRTLNLKCCWGSKRGLKNVGHFVSESAYHPISAQWISRHLGKPCFMHSYGDQWVFFHYCTKLRNYLLTSIGEVFLNKANTSS